MTTTTLISPTVDYTTGRVTIAGHVDGDTYVWAGEFDVPVAFVDDTMESAQHIGDADGMLVDWPSIHLAEVRFRPEAPGTFFEERFPDEIAQGATGGPRFKTTAAETAAGYRSANKDWSQARHFYEVGQATKPLAEFELVRSFFYVVFGAFDGFRFKDFTNFRVTQSTGVLSLVSGSVYQLCKAERYGSRTYLRKIFKPVAGGATVWRIRP